MKAHSRRTSPQRFEPLHRVALDLLHELEQRFHVTRTESPTFTCDLSDVELARPTIGLTPASASAAPTFIAFTAFPGVLVQCGRWVVEAFPVSGCDRCGETLDAETARLRELIDDVVQGRFRERISFPLVGAAGQEWELWSDHGRRRSGLRLDGARSPAGRPRRTIVPVAAMVGEMMRALRVSVLARPVM